MKLKTLMWDGNSGGVLSYILSQLTENVLLSFSYDPQLHVLLFLKWSTLSAIVPFGNQETLP